jgi:ammonia channel protein AmtB
MGLPTEVLKAWEACDRTDTLFVFVCCVFCKSSPQDASIHELTKSGWGIIPAVGIAYSGYTTRSNSLSAIMPAILAVIVCTIQWFLVGYTLTYGEGGAVFGDFKYAFHRNVLAEPVGTIPAILFSFFQLVFQATVCAIAVGGACERGRILPLIPFIFVSKFPNYCLHVNS